MGHDTDRQQVRNRKFMFLRIGTSTFALPLNVVREVLGLGQLSALPNMPSYFAGLINLRGKIVSAVDLKKSLSFVDGTQAPSDQTRRPCVIITEFEGRMFGAIVDDVVEVQAIPSPDIDNTLNSNKDVFDGVIKRDGHALSPILNLNRALKVDELLTLSTRNAI